MENPGRSRVGRRCALAALALVPVLAACGQARTDARASRGDDESAAVNASLRALLDAPDAGAFRAAAQARGIETDADGVLVDVRTRGLAPAHRDHFDLPGVRVRHFSPRYERVSASVRDPAALRALARLRPVRRIAPEYGTAGTTQ